MLAPLKLPFLLLLPSPLPQDLNLAVQLALQLLSLLQLQQQLRHACPLPLPVLPNPQHLLPSRAKQTQLLQVRSRAAATCFSVKRVDGSGNL